MGIPTLNPLKWLLIISAGGLLAAAACSDDAADQDAAVDQDAEADAYVYPFEFPARVLQVVDGDTIHVEFNGQEITVRFLGIDTPELTPTPEPWAEEARQFTIGYATPPWNVGLEFDDNACGTIPYPSSCFDLYDRMLAYIRTPEGYDLNALLVANGLATVYSTSFGRRSDYLQAQSEAQSQGLGIWSQ